MIVIKQAETQEELQGILALQQANLMRSLTAEEAGEQGFLTVEHNLDLLTRMNDTSPHTIAKDGDSVVGYVLTMLQQFRTEIAVLAPMFERLDALEWQGKPLREVPYFVMGQVCVAKSHRGQGVFDALYDGLRRFQGEQFAVVITEVSSRNTRSLRAHERVGFEVLQEFTMEHANGSNWIIVAWGLRGAEAGAALASTNV